MVAFTLSRALVFGRKAVISRLYYQLKSTQCILHTRATSSFTFLDSEKTEWNSMHCRNDPYALVEDDLKYAFTEIKTELTSPDRNLNEILWNYFNGQSKSRMSIILLMARALNNHVCGCESILLPNQRQVAMTAEMLHVGGRLHNMSGVGANEFNFDNISAQTAILVGDYIFSFAIVLLARIQQNSVYEEMGKILGEQVEGEFMQDSSSSTNGPEDEMLSRYLVKTFKMTGSLLAFSCKAVAILSGAEPHVQKIALEFGRNAGIAYQIADDDAKLTLSNTNNTELEEGHVGLPSISNALFVTPEMSYLIEQRKFLARQHCANAVRILDDIRDCPEKEALMTITNGLLSKSSE